eukprot:6228092-Prymnesium_polylepis.1
MDGLVRGKAGEVDGLADSRSNGAVGVRRGSVRARAGAGKGGRGSLLRLRCSQGATPWALGAARALALGAPTSLNGIL